MRHIRPEFRAASGDSSGGEKSAGPDYVAVSPLGSVVMPGLPVSCRRQQREHTRSAPAWLRRCCKFLGVPAVGLKKEPTQWALTTTHTQPVAKSLLDVGDVVTRRQDTSRAHVQVVEPLVEDLRMAQVSDSCHLLPGSFGEGVCSSGA